MSNRIPIGANLPPRRDQPIKRSEPEAFAWGAGINAPAARDRMMEYFSRDQIPSQVNATLASALNGDLHYQSLLFIAMIDSWPKLQANLAEIARAVSVAPWQVIPYADRGKDPTPKAQDLAVEVEEIVWRMKPNAARGENGLEDTISSLAIGYFFGHSVEEILWERGKSGEIKPRATRSMPARYYGYPYDLSQDDPDDRLMLDPAGGTGVRQLIDFPEHRFLVGVNKGHKGHATLAAPLRALAPYWLASVYGLKWLVNFTQIYGIPWRHAEVADRGSRNIVKQALVELGSQGVIVTEPGAKINILSPPMQAGSALPQRELIALADEQCDIFILGQTLTSGTEDSGSRALGEVHQETLNRRIDAVSDFVGKVLTYQFIPAIVSLNWGDRDDVPEFWSKSEIVRDETKLADRDDKLGILSGDLPVSRTWLYERHGVPVPEDGDDLYQPGGNADKAPEPDNPDEKDKADKKDEEILAALQLIIARYNENQPRVPKGSSEGGRWTSTGRGEGMGKGREAVKGEMRPGTEEDRKRLKVPPAYKDLIVSDDVDVDLIGVATKPNGKPWLIYSDRYIQEQQDAKWGRIADLDSEFDDLAAKMDADILGGGSDAGSAATLRLIRQTGMRNGGVGRSNVYLLDPEGNKIIGSDGKPLKETIKTFGASSLRGEHIKVDGDKITMDFPGKSGVRQHIQIEDKVLADVMRPKAGKDVSVFGGSDAKTLKYLGKISGGKYKVHDFRTYHATLEAESRVFEVVKSGKIPQNVKEFEKLKMQIATPVSQALGNAPKVALKNYIHPDIFNELEPK